MTEKQMSLLNSIWDLENCEKMVIGCNRRKKFQLKASVFEIHI